MPSYRSRVVAAVCLLALAGGCGSARRPGGGLPGVAETGAAVAVTFAPPADVPIRRGAAADTIHAATEVLGRVVRAAGDTLVLRLTGVRRAAQTVVADVATGREWEALIVRGPGTRLRVLSGAPERTHAVVLLGILAVVGALALFVALLVPET